jgi:hypothetical protein
MTTLANDVAGEAVKILAPILIATLTWVAGRIARLIKARAENEHLRGMLLRLDDIVLAVVKEVHQVTVEALKAASADGKLSQGAGQAVKQSAIAAVKAHLGPKGMAELGVCLDLTTDGMDRLLATKVEAAVYTTKHEGSTNGVHPPVGLMPFES